MTEIQAYKMDGLGNDFIIIDRRKDKIDLSKEQIINIADRKKGPGCDQIIIIDKDKEKKTNAKITFYNSDGGETGACGNGSRCISYFLMNEKKLNKSKINTESGILKAKLTGKTEVSVDMGIPNFDWQKIPLVKKMNHANVKIKTKHFGILSGYTLSVGNPHIIFFKDITFELLKKIGPQIEHHEFFPERCNVTFAEVMNKKNIAVKVWERGAGLTLACGTAACATAVAASKLGLTGKKVNIHFKNGTLHIEWTRDKHIIMTGSVSNIKSISLKI
jgi:diaminopimelate epimerase